MTDPYAAPTRPDDIEDGSDTASVQLDREADALLLGAEERSFAARPLRQAVREDAVQVRDWGRERAVRLRGAVEDEPVKATLYALGLGVVIGLLIAR
jgi:hypothetical protein